MNSTKGKREIIIIVDDNSANLIIERDSFVRICDVLTANSGKELFQLLEKVIPNLILLDTKMAEMDGYEVAKVLKSNENTMHIPIIFLTDVTDPEDEAKGLSLGAVDYMTKPFSMELLVKRVSLHLLLERQKKVLQTAFEETENALQALQEAQITSSAIFNANPQINMLFDSSFNVVDCNPATITTLEFETKEDLIAGFYESLAQRILPADPSDKRDTRPMPEKFMTAIKEGYYKYEIELLLRNQKRRLIIELKRIPYESSFAIILYAYDMTDIYDREKELMRAHEMN